MLQLRQLENVLERFPKEVVTLRNFLRSAEPRPYAYGSLAAVASQLRKAGRFQRDLASHLMVFTHQGISAPDLLGIVALAAGELNGAATARDSDAHEVLRFILTGRTSSNDDGRPGRFEATEDVSRSFWSDALVCVIVLALVVGMVYARHLAGLSTQQKQAALASLPAEPQPLLRHDLLPESVATPPSERFVDTVPLLKAPSRSADAAKFAFPQQKLYPPAAKSDVLPSTQRLLATRTSPVSTLDHAAPIVRVPAGPTSPAIETRMLGSSASRGGVPTAIPTAVLSQRLNARSLPANDPAIDPYSGRAYPRLWRRQSAGASTSDTAESAVLVAANAPPSRPGTYTSHAASAGTVRPVSLGTMAANVVYSPAPAYPPAAATARVQGQVTIQAEVDRDGSVASARVVSGPPLLRDAALDAVLQWRYRPRTAGGRPITAAATAMVEFELP